MTVSDAEISEAILLLLERTKQVVEPAGATPLAAVLTTRLMLRVRKSLAYFLEVTLTLALFTELLNLVLLRVRESLNSRLHFLIFREVWNIFHTFLPRQTQIS